MDRKYSSSLFLILFNLAQSTEPPFFTCDKEIFISSSTYVKSPDFPNTYSPISSCRYVITAPYDHIIDLKCNVQMECRNSFEFNSFYINRDGTRELKDGEYLCLGGRFRRYSNFRRLTIGYIADGGMGKFICQLNVQKQPLTCGWYKNATLEGRAKAHHNQYPSVVALTLEEKPGKAFCGATIISHNFMVSSADCVAPHTKAPHKIVALVGHIKTNSPENPPFTRSYSINEIIIHPKYDKKSKASPYDIALLRTGSTIEWSASIGPICLPNGRDTFETSYVTTVGWGATAPKEPPSPFLHALNLRVISNNECRMNYANIKKASDLDVCAVDFTTSALGPCEYDWGGPLIQSSTHQTFVGILNAGTACGKRKDAAAICTRVSAFLPWIQECTNLSFTQEEVSKETTNSADSIDF